MSIVWEIKALDDLSGCWIQWESPAGRMSIERNPGGLKAGYSLSHWPENNPSADDVEFGPFQSIADAQEAAVRECGNYGKRALKAAKALAKRCGVKA